jgi:hypothetical protein
MAPRLQKLLADLALGKLRLKLPAPPQALHGRFDHQHATIVVRILAHIDYLDEAIAELRSKSTRGSRRSRRPLTRSARSHGFSVARRR